MIVVLQWAAFVLYFSPLLLVGYVIYQMIRDARRERMGRQLSTMPLAEDEPNNPFALNRRLLGISLPETRPTMQEAGDNLARAFAPIGRYYPDSDTWEPAPYVKQEPLHDLSMECKMMEGI